MESEVDLETIFRDAHRENNKRGKLFQRLEILRTKNLDTLKRFHNDLKLEICELLKIWLEASGTCTQSKIKLYRISDRMKDLVSFYKNYHDKSITPADNYYLKNYVKRVQDKLTENLVSVPMTQAPLLLFEDGLRLANDLWEVGGERSKFTSKLCAVLLKLTLYTGGRTGDFLKLKWRDIKISKAFNGDKALSLFCITKTNQERKLPGRKDIFCPVTDPNNPLDWLTKLSLMTKASKNDLVFKRENGKVLSTDLYVYHLARSSERINLNFYPKGHSARNGLIATLSLSGISHEFLKIACEWKPSSEMPQAYIRNNLGLSEIGTAYKLRQLIKSNKLSKLQKQINNNTD